MNLIPTSHPAIDQLTVACLFFKIFLGQYQLSRSGPFAEIIPAQHKVRKVSLLENIGLEDSEIHFFGQSVLDNRSVFL